MILLNETFDASNILTTYDIPRPVGANFIYTADPTQTITGYVDYHGLDVKLSSSSANLINTTNLYPFESTAEYDGAGAMRGLYAVYGLTYHGGVGNVERAVNFRALHQNKGGGITQNAWMFSAENPILANGGTIQKVHGLHIAELTTGSVENYGLYVLTKDNYIKGGLTLANNTPPIASPVDGISLYSVDVNGLATLGLFSEQTVVNESIICDSTLLIKHNGSTYKILLQKVN